MATLDPPFFESMSGVTGGIMAKSIVSLTLRLFTVVVAPMVLSSCVPTIQSLFFNADNITPKFSDVKYPVYSNDILPRNLERLSLMNQKKDRDGNLLLSPGFYEGMIETFCIDPGIGSPSRGQTYLFVPTKGRKSAIIKKLVGRANRFPEILKKDIQLAVWAIMTDTQINAMSPRMITVFSKLLDQSDIVEMGLSTLSVLASDVIERSIIVYPEPLRNVIRAHNNLRRLLTSTQASYEAIERLAVSVTKPLSARGQLFGKWYFHDQKYYIRFFPSGYSSTRVQVYVPGRKIGYSRVDVLAASMVSSNLIVRSLFGSQPQMIIGGYGQEDNSQVKLDLSGDLIVPDNSSSQRLALSSRVEEDIPNVEEDDQCKDLPPMQVRVWVNAFIPKHVPKVTHSIPKGRFAGQTYVDGPPIPLQRSRAFLTNNRSFDASDSNSLSHSKMHSEFTVKFEKSGPSLINKLNIGGRAVEIDPKTFEFVSSDVASSSGMSITGPYVIYLIEPCIARVYVKLSTALPSIFGASLVANMDVEGSFVIDPIARTVAFYGLVDTFPAYEAYVSIDGGAPLTVFRQDILPGKTPMNLIGPPTLVPSPSRVSF